MLQQAIPDLSCKNINIYKFETRREAFVIDTRCSTLKGEGLFSFLSELN